MEALKPFMSSVGYVLGMFGVSPPVEAEPELHEQMAIRQDVTTVIGVVGKVSGNVAFSYSKETALRIVGAMMGMSVEEWSEMAGSAVAELSNMCAGQAVQQLAAASGLALEVTTPSVVTGADVYFILSFNKTLVYRLETDLGVIEIHVGIEL